MSPHEHATPLLKLLCSQATVKYQFNTYVSLVEF